MPSRAAKHLANLLAARSAATTASDVSCCPPMRRDARCRTLSQDIRRAVAETLTFSSTVSAADKPIPKDDHTPLHGGIVVKAANTDFELVAKPDLITIDVRDHGKPAATQGGFGKVTLLSDSEKTEATLTPAGDNKLEAKGNFKVSAGPKW